MSIDLERLSPAPWMVMGPTDHAGLYYVRPADDGPHVAHVGNNRNSGTDAEFIALARNAFAGDPDALAWWEANRVTPPAPPA